MVFVMIIPIRQSFEFHLNTYHIKVLLFVDLEKIIVITIIIKYLQWIITAHCAVNKIIYRITFANY